MGLLTKRLISITSVVLLVVTVNGRRVLSAPSRVPLEYSVKAAYIFNFARFTTWPESAFEAPASPLVIGVLGHDAFVPALLSSLKEASVEGRPVKLKEVVTPADLTGVHLLYVARSEEERLADDLFVLRHRPILTVSDTRGFTEQGGMVEFSANNGKVGFNVNTRAIERSGLKASSQMLQFAQAEE